MKKNSFAIFLAVVFFGFGAIAYAATSAAVLPTVKPIPVVTTTTKTVTPVPVTTTNVIAPISGLKEMPPDPLEKPTTVKTVTPVSVTATQQMPVDPLEKPDDPFGKSATTQMPPDPLEKQATTEMPDDPFGKSATMKRPPDPLEKQTAGAISTDEGQRPPDPLESNAGSRLLNEIMKGGQAKEPGKLENSGPSVLGSFSEKDFANPEAVSSFVKEVRDVVPAVKGVDVADNMVKVSYEREAKIFGLISVKYNLTAEGDSDTGKVEVKKPWWLFFAKNDAGAFQSALQNNVDEMGSMSEIMSLELQEQMERRAKIIQTLSNIISKISKTEESLVANIK